MYKGIGIHNIKRTECKQISQVYTTRTKKYTHWWWYINRRIGPPPKFGG